MVLFKILKYFGRHRIQGSIVIGGSGYLCYFFFWPEQPLYLRIKNDYSRHPPVTLDRLEHLPTRKEQIAKLKTEHFDVLVIGGGATGAGVALDSVTRGLKTAMVEKDDFSSATSSRSTKLIHGGVRYLEKAILNLDYEQYRMVREALCERANLLRIAPHLTYPMPIMLPTYSWFGFLQYWAGLQIYDWIAGSRRVMRCYTMNKARTMEEFPMLRQDKLKRTIVYYDGAQNDARMNTSLAVSAARYGAATANHTEVMQLLKNDESKVCGAVVKDQLTGDEYEVRAKSVVNACGVFTDRIRQMDNPEIRPICIPSQGVHVVLPGYYSPNHMGLLDPNTSDGRVIFFLPWEGACIAGTTDLECEVTDSPAPTDNEILFVLKEIDKYLANDIEAFARIKEKSRGRPPAGIVRRGDILSAWAGIRPLVKDPTKGDTQSLARNHVIEVSSSNLVTIAGGKWTTYRNMAAETVDRVVKTCGLKPTRPCQTLDLLLEGAYNWFPATYVDLVQDFGLEVEVAKHLSRTYGDKAFKVARWAQLTGNRTPVVGKRLHPQYPYIEAEVYYAMHEYACTAVDVLWRRTRLAFLNADAALEALPRVVEIMGGWLKWDKQRKQYETETAIRLLNREMGLSLKKEFSEVRATDKIELTTEEKDEYLRRFRALDKDAKGYITMNDLRKHFKITDERRLSEEQLREILREVDVNKNGQVEQTEYLQVMSAIKTGKLPGNRLAMAALLSKELEQAIEVDRSGGGL